MERGAAQEGPVSPNASRDAAGARDDLGTPGEPGGGGGVRGFARATFGSQACWRAVIAIGLAVLSIQLMNRSLFPLFDAVFTYARDVSITFSALVAIAIGLISLSRPKVLGGRRLTLLMLALWGLGSVGMVAGLALGSPVVLVLGACLFVTGRGWSSIGSNLMAVCLPLPQAMVAIVAGVTLGQALDLAVRLLLPQLGCVTLLVAAVPAVALLASRSVRELTDELAVHPPATELSVTRPASYLPLTSNLYVCLILVQAAFGFALRFGEVDGSPAFGNLSLPVLVVLLAITVALRGRFVGDEIVNVTMLALTAGFLLVIIGGGSPVMLANGLLTIGTSVFSVALYGTLVALASRNRLSSLSIVGWGQGLSGLATTLGALLGTTTNRLELSGHHQQLALLVALVLLALVAYMLLGLRGFSLRTTIEGVVPPEPDIDLERIGEDLFARRCEEVARRFELTPREAEVFEMLARGRNREHIEGALGVSRNTVKAHVKHVYAKLGIHSHQELIDLMEAGPR